MADRKVIVNGLVYEETATRKVIVNGRIYEETISVAPSGFQAAWARNSNVMVQ